MTWDPNVVNWWRIVGYENRVTSDESFTQARKEFAEIPAGAATTVFYELELKDQWFTGPLTLGDVEIRWVTPFDGRIQPAARGHHQPQLRLQLRRPDAAAGSSE